MIVIDMDMPKNCSECYESHIIDCNLIFSGCANCGRHPKCPIKCDIEDIKAEIKERFNKNTAIGILEIIDKHTAESEE